MRNYSAAKDTISGSMRCSFKTCQNVENGPQLRSHIAQGLNVQNGVRFGLSLVAALLAAILNILPSMRWRGVTREEVTGDE